MIDATCALSGIRYPTDLGLLNEGREKLESIIDTLWKGQENKDGVKPRMYRQTAGKAFLSVEKKRKHRADRIRKAIGKQLCFVRRNLGIISSLCEDGSSLEYLSVRQYRDLLVTSEVHRHQLTMYENKAHHVEARIVSISQPHVRPIVRGKRPPKWSSAPRSQSAE